MRAQPESIECVDWHANVRQAGLLGRSQVDGEASVGVRHVGHGETYKGQGQVGYHVAF